MTIRFYPPVRNRMFSMPRLCLALLFAALLNAQGTPARPKLTGLAHIALSAHDFAASRAYYRDFLGYEEFATLPKADGSVGTAFIKINDRQYIELSPENQPGTDRLKHIALETENAEAMRLYLKSKGVAVPDATPKGKSGNSNFMIKDPEGHQVEIVQYEPDGWSMRDKGKAMPATRISTHIRHMGLIVTKLEPMRKFYEEVLGFTETWRGSKDGKVLSWTNMKLPESDDIVKGVMLTRGGAVVHPSFQPAPAA